MNMNAGGVSLLNIGTANYDSLIQSFAAPQRHFGITNPIMNFTMNITKQN